MKHRKYRARKHYYGCYRVTLLGGRFAQITKGRWYKSTDEFFRDAQDGRHWWAEVRDADSGDLLHYAGVWETLADAINEVAGEQTFASSLDRFAKRNIR